MSAADAKRKRVVPDDEQKGAARARAFLQEFAALPMDTMDKDEAVRKVRAVACQGLALSRTSVVSCMSFVKLLMCMKMMLPDRRHGRCSRSWRPTQRASRR